MQIKKKIAEDFIIISLVGSMEAYDAERFEKEVISLIKKKKLDIIIDLHGLEYISSSGLRALLNIKGQMQKEARRLLLASIKGKVLEVFRVSRLLDIFQVYKDVKEAMRR